MPTPYHRIAVHLRHAKSVVVCAHVSPDGDAIGSTLGLTIALREAGIPAVPTLADDREPPSAYSFLPGFDLFVPAKDLNTPDVFVALDTPNISRLGEAASLAKEAENLIVMDHHPDNDSFGSVNLLDPQAAATGQMIWRLIERLETDPSPEIAICLYVAIFTDTGRFQYQNTTPAVLRDAADILEVGVDPAEVARMVYQSRTRAAMELDARVLSRLTVANNDRVAYTFITETDYEETGAKPEETENLVDNVRNLRGVDVAMLFRIGDGTIRANLRAKTNFDVGAIAREFGGGGHKAAAGFTVEGNLDDLLATLLAKLPGSNGGC